MHIYMIDTDGLYVHYLSCVCVCAAGHVHLREGRRYLGWLLDRRLSLVGYWTRFTMTSSLKDIMVNKHTYMYML